jgi:hypothetical protein
MAAAMGGAMRGRRTERSAGAVLETVKLAVFGSTSTLPTLTGAFALDLPRAWPLQRCRLSRVEGASLV